MCTPWTIPRLMRWRIGEWSSCLFACKLQPSDDETDEFHHSTNEAKPAEAEQDETRIYVIKPGKKPSKHNSKKHRSIPIQDSDQQPNNKSTRSHIQSFKEEDYIVFCVKEDGTFEVVRDEKSESAQHVKNWTQLSRTINLKGEDEESIYFDSRAAQPGMRAETHHKKNNDDDDDDDDDGEESGTHSQESNFTTSTRSYSSTGSFAFPVDADCVVSGMAAQ